MQQTDRHSKASNENLDDRFLVLGTEKAGQVDDFLEAIRSCINEADKYDLCVRKRDCLLETTALQQVEYTYYATAFSESSTYQASKGTDPTWQAFTSTASKGAQRRHRITNEIKNAAALWGDTLVHFISEGRGDRFAIQLASTARQHPNWKGQALPRLQQLVCRRIQLSGTHGRHAFLQSLETIDLRNAKEWADDTPFVKLNDPESVQLPLAYLSVEQLPRGYTFDAHRLIVQVDCSNLRSVEGACRPHSLLSTSQPPSDQSSTDQSPADQSSTDQSSTDQFPTVPSPLSVYKKKLGAKVFFLNGVDGHTESRDKSDDIPEQGVADCAAKDASALGATASTHSLGVTDTSHIPIVSLRRSLRKPTNTIVPESQDTPTTAGNKRCVSNKNHRTYTQADKATALEVAQTHARRLSELLGKLPDAPRRPPPTPKAFAVVPWKRKRAASLPPFDATNCHQHGHTSPQQRHSHEARPTCDWRADETYVAQAIQELRDKSCQEPFTRGAHNAGILLPILQMCDHPNTDITRGPIDVELLDGLQAQTLLDHTTPDVPIITERQQHFQWTDPDQPIREFFDWIEDHNRVVSVQIPSRLLTESSHELRSIRHVCNRFLDATVKDDPWNILDCENPVPASLPDFLTGWNCQLLARIRDQVLNGVSAERPTASREDWTEWRCLEHWALLSEGGHSTAPHMDAHGLSTWITVQQGLFGFVWMSRPTDLQREQWMANPECVDEQQKWRYWILKPGQTVFFPSGTIHGVFRSKQHQTFGLGGHILQWSGLSRWIDIITKQTQFPDCTNEDVEDAWKWYPVVEALVKMRVDRSVR